MIVETSQLPRFRMQVTMVDGGFDPLHAGHIAYFQEARALGLPVLCNVAADRYVEPKHPPLLTEQERITVLDALRFIDFTHLCRTGTAAVLRELRPRYYVKGEDWKDRLPKEEVATAREHDIEIVFLDCVSQSSTRILEQYADAVHGCGRGTASAGSSGNGGLR